MKSPYLSIVFFLLVTTLWWHLERRRAARAKRVPAAWTPASDAIPRRSRWKGGDPLEDLLKLRIVRLHGAIDDGNASIVIAQLLLLESEDRSASIILEIDSKGGSVGAALAIIDTIEGLAPPVHTVCRGWAGGMAGVILVCGAGGSRRAIEGGWIGLGSLSFPTSTGMAQEERESMERKVKELELQLMRRLAERTGLTETEAYAELHHTRPLTPEQAKEMGLIDEVTSILDDDLSR